MTEKRENEIDTLKGIGILFVVASHCDANLRMFFSYPFSFTMPLFFWVAGYFLTNGDAFPMFVWKKFKRLMCSYWLWCTLSADIFLVMTRLRNPLAFFPFSADAARPFLEPGTFLWLPPFLNPPLWFLPALFAVLLMLYPCVRLSGKALCGFVLSMCAATPFWQSVFAKECLFACGSFPPALFFGVLGILAARNKAFLKSVLSVPMTLILLMAGFGLSVGHWADVFSASSPLFFMAAVASILGWYGAAMRLDCRFLRFVGRNSMILFGLHLPVLLVVKEIVFGHSDKNADNSTLPDNALEFVCVSIVVLTAAAGYSVLSRKAPKAKYAVVFAAFALFGYYWYKSPY